MRPSRIELFSATLMALVAIVASVIILPRTALAASYTWDGGGATNNWSDCDNWSSNICPVAADSVTFNGTSTKDSTIDGAWGGSITGITIASGYTGTITAARSLTMSGGYNQATGTFNAGSQVIDMNQNYTLSGGIYIASSATTTLAYNMTVTGTPNFDANGGVWNFDNDSSTLACNNIAFNRVGFTQGGNRVKTINSDCTMPLGAAPTITGLITLNGTITGSGTLTVSGNAFNATGSILNTGATLSGFSGLIAASSLTIDSGTFNFSAYNPMTVGAHFTLRNGAAFTAPTGTMSVAANLTINGGTTFNANGGTLNLNGSNSAGTIDCNGATFNLVMFTANGGSPKTIAATCNLPVGNNPTTSNPITLNGTLTGTGTFTTNYLSGTLTVNATGSLAGFNGLVSGDGTTFHISGANFDASSYTTFDINNIFTLSSGGTFTAPAGTATFASTFTINAGTTFNANGGTITFDSTGNQNITCNNAVFHLVVLTGAGNKYPANGCNLPLGHNPTVSTGTIVLNGTMFGTGVGTFTNSIQLFNSQGFSGFSDLSLNFLQVSASFDASQFNSFTLNSTLSLGAGVTFTAPPLITTSAHISINATATFNANNGTVNFTGNNNTLTGTATFYNVSKTTATGAITGSGTLTALGTLSLNTNASLSGFTTVNAGNLQVANAYTQASTIATNISGWADFNGAVTINPGATLTAPPTMSIAGNFTNNGTFNHNNSTVTMDGAGNQSLSAGQTFYNLTKTNAGTITGSGTLTVLDTLTLLSAPSGFSTISTDTLDVSGNYTQAGGTVTVTSGVLLGGNFTLNTGSVFTAPISGMTLPGNFTVQAGATYNAPADNMTVAGNFANAGTFNANNGTVILNGGDQSISGNTTFYNFEKAGNSTLTFGAGSTQTVNGRLLLEGDSFNEPLTLQSSVAGSEWYLDLAGTQDLQYLTVSDSEATTTTATACDSTDDGGNDNWDFIYCGPPIPTPDDPTVNPAAAAANFGFIQAFLAGTGNPGAFPPNFLIPQGNYLSSQIANILEKLPVAGVTVPGIIMATSLVLLGAVVLAFAGRAVWGTIATKKQQRDGSNFTQTGNKTLY